MAAEAARWAPSIHNSQPWLLRRLPDGLGVLEDAVPVAARHRPARAATASSPAALPSSTRASRCARSATPSTSPSLPDPAEPALVAHRPRRRRGVRATAGRRRAGSDGRRCGTRTAGSTARTPSPRRTCSTCARPSSVEGARLSVADSAARRRLAHLLRRAVRAQAADPELRERGRALGPARRQQRDHVDGIPSNALGTSPFPVDSLVHGGHRGAPEAGEVEEELARSTVLVISTREDSRHDWVLAGLALERLLLVATSKGLVATFADQALQDPELRPEVADVLGIWGKPQVLLRVGRAAGGRPAHPAPPAERDPRLSRSPHRARSARRAVRAVRHGCWPRLAVVTVWHPATVTASRPWVPWSPFLPSTGRTCSRRRCPPVCDLARRRRPCGVAADRPAVSRHRRRSSRRTACAPRSAPTASSSPAGGRARSGSPPASSSPRPGPTSTAPSAACSTSARRRSWRWTAPSRRPAWSTAASRRWAARRAGGCSSTPRGRDAAVGRRSAAACGSSKLVLPGAVLAALPGAEVVEGLAAGVPGPDRCGPRPDAPTARRRRRPRRSASPLPRPSGSGQRGRPPASAGADSPSPSVPEHQREPLAAARPASSSRATRRRRERQRSDREPGGAHGRQCRRAKARSAPTAPGRRCPSRPAPSAGRADPRSAG